MFPTIKERVREMTANQAMDWILEDVIELRNQFGFDGARDLLNYQIEQLALLEQDEERGYSDKVAQAIYDCYGTNIDDHEIKKFVAETRRLVDSLGGYHHAKRFLTAQLAVVDDELRGRGKEV